MGEWGGGCQREGGRKIAFVLQTTTGDPCIVSPEIRWEMKKTYMLRKVHKNWRFLRVCSFKSSQIYIFQ